MHLPCVSVGSARRGYEQKAVHIQSPTRLAHQHVANCNGSYEQFANGYIYRFKDGLLSIAFCNPCPVSRCS